MKFQINYKYAAINKKMRTGALILDAPDSKTATKAATDELNKEIDWFKITAVVQLSDK